MVGSMFAAISGLKSHQTKMDVIGNNIANVNTWGFKSQSANFMDATYRTRIAGSASSDKGTGGGVNSSQIGYGTNVGSITVNYTTGNWNPTGWGSDCMINGPGFFVVSSSTKGVGTDPTAEDGVFLSRVGILGIDSEGYLVDVQGNYVLDTEGNVIQEAGMSFSSLTIEADGTVTGVVAGGNKADGTAAEVGSVVEIGQLGVASVQNPNGLNKNQGYYYTIGPNAGKVTLGAANKATGDILGGYLEMSNTDLSTEMASMITTQRGFQANTKIITVTDQMLEELVNMKR